MGEKNAQDLAKRVEQRLDSKIHAGRMGIRNKLRLIVTAEEEASLAVDEEKQQSIAAFTRDTIRNVPNPEVLSIISRLGIIEPAPEFIAPEGGFVCKVLFIERWSLSHEEHIDLNTPQTNADWDVRKVGAQYLPPTKAPLTLEEYILPYFGKGVNTTVEKAEKWMSGQEPHALQWAHGRAPTTIIGAVQNLPAQLQKFGFAYNSAGVYSGHECELDRKRRVRGAWRSGRAGRESHLSSVSYEWSDYCLPAFSRKLRPAS